VLEILKDTKIDFMGNRRIWMGISAFLVAASLIVLPIRGINLGIEFTGGAEVQVKCADPPDLGKVRAALKSAGLSSNLVTTIGDPKENELYIRLGSEAAETKEQDLTSALTQALRAATGWTGAEGRIDLNAADAATVEQLLEGFPDITRADAQALAAAISEERRKVAVLRSLDALTGLDKMTPQVMEYLRSRAVVGPFAIRSQSYIGPTVGRELLQKAFWAVLGSLVGMLAYIGFRFHFRWGVAAVLALVHDTIVTLGFFSLFGREMSLPVVAAFLTLIGYSTNDTVVVFDRIRENLRMRGAADLSAIINLSINQTLSRTILTSGLTWLVVLALFFLAGEPLNPFSFVLVIGIVVGSYSSIYIASPILVLWQQFLDRRKGARKGSPPSPKASPEKKARKVRTA